MKINCESLSGLFKALSEEVRLRMLALLAFSDKGELCVCDIMSALDIPQSTASRHLAHLRGADLVKGRRKGAWTYYRLVQDGEGPWKWLEQALNDLRRECPQVEQDLEALKRYLATKQESC
ncbi:ArsR/SmtB family transcription factor [Desulfocurvibacter africanus]|uniref:ArsR/SmtB family transcription factor n=1 Tax=Desulfocurvibacter africanus TaxID=873 RepID=UPI000488D706|nr:metalloregulator ArsR/SmtB family transcription factor [Desulfocurvibacter africanus]